MINSNDFEGITCFNLDKELVGRTIKAFNQDEGEIWFTDGSILKITYLENADCVGFELFEEPIDAD